MGSGDGRGVMSSEEGCQKNQISGRGSKTFDFFGIPLLLSLRLLK